MQIFNEVNDENFMIFAARHYYNPRCIDIEEFYEDLNRFKYVKRLLNRYIETGKLSERLKQPARGAKRQRNKRPKKIN